MHNPYDAYLMLLACIFKQELAEIDAVISAGMISSCRF